jgi:hypothetical protein
MTSWVAWLVVVLVGVALGAVATHFSVRTVRWFTAIVAVGLVVAVTSYGLNKAETLGMPPSGPPDLQTAFAKSADAIAAALLRPLWLGHSVPEPGRVGWAVIVVLLLLGYRQLEAQAVSMQAPVLDTSQLANGQPSIPAKGSRAAGGLTDAQRHEQLAAELKFRLAAMEIRSPSILPGGSRSNGLASIAEDSGVAGANLAGAIVRFLGLLWPGPRRWMLRVWVESPRDGETDGDTRVTVELDDPRTGETLATKTITAASIDEAASMIAGYVTRQVFGADPTTPPWCYGASDGHDLGAMLIARQERVYADSWEAVRRSRNEQIRVLQTVTTGNKCAGLVRYELAQLHDLGTHHLTALRLHSVNREQYPRFFRGRYRLGMSLEMAANPGLTFRNPAAARYMIGEVLAVLSRCGLTERAASSAGDIVATGEHGHYRLSDPLSLELLAAAMTEMRVIRRQLTLPVVLWAELRHREERTVWRPHRSLRVRQSFRDGASVAELLVAARIILNDPARRSSMPIPAYRHALRIVAALTGDVSAIEALFRGRAAAKGTGAARAAGGAARRPAAMDQVRMLPWLRRTASWQAAYNAACIYSALAQKDLAGDDLVVACLQRAIDSRDSEMERAYDWIAYDPDFLPLKNSPPDQFRAFKRFLRDQKRKDYPRRSRVTPSEDGEDDSAGDGTRVPAPPRGIPSQGGVAARDPAARDLGPGPAGTCARVRPVSVSAGLRHERDISGADRPRGTCRPAVGGLPGEAGLRASRAGGLRGGRRGGDPAGQPHRRRAHRGVQDRDRLQADRCLRRLPGDVRGRRVRRARQARLERGRPWPCGGCGGRGGDPPADGDEAGWLGRRRPAVLDPPPAVLGDRPAADTGIAPARYSETG